MTSDTSAAATERLVGLEELADHVVAILAGHGDGVEGNVLTVHHRHGLTRFANSSVHQHVREDSTEVMLTVAVDGRTATASTTRVDHDSLRALVDGAVASARLQPVDPLWPGATPPEPVTAAGNLDPGTAAADPDERVGVVAAFIDADDALDAAGYVDTELIEAAFASTAGQRASGATTRATLDGIHQTATSAGSAHQTSVRIADLDGAAAGRRAADRARRSEEFVDVEPGRFEVILGPEAVSTVLTFLGVYGFNAKSHHEGGSFAELGAAQFDPSITILEDPTDPRSVGLPFDAEGTPRRRNVLVADGVTRSLAHDRRTAARTGVASTGNAVPGGSSMGPVPTRIVMPPGEASVDDMVARVRYGLLVTQFHYVRVLDPKTLVATGLTRNGTFLIRDGAVAQAVGNLRFTQSFVDALAPEAVLGVGDDDRYADGEFGAGVVICPSLHLAGWNFTGGAQG